MIRYLRDHWAMILAVMVINSANYHLLNHFPHDDLLFWLVVFEAMVVNMTVATVSLIKSWKVIAREWHGS